MHRLSRFATLAVIALGLGLAAGTAMSAAPADSLCDQFIGALRDGNYDQAAKLVDPAVQAVMNAAALQSALAPVVAERGKITRWQLSRHSKAGNYEVIIARVEFEHGAPIGLQLAVTPPNIGVSGMYFVEAPEAATAAGAEPSAALESRAVELLTAVQAGKFDEATAHFDSTMKAALSAEKLASVWNSLTAATGKLSSWKLAQSVDGGNKTVLIYTLTFEHGQTMEATIGVGKDEPHEITDLFLKPLGAPSAATSPPYANPASFKSERVTVGSAPTLCAGVITIPIGNGPFPAAILVAGSGPNDMDETIGPNHVFKDIAEGLSSRGIEVLRYDKRTHTHKNIDPKTFTVQQEYIDDAVAAVSQLRARHDVDRARIFVIGHSAGAQLAPDIAKQAAPIAGVVMLAPSARPLLNILIQQYTYLGAPPDHISQLERVRQEISEGKFSPDQTVPGLGGVTVRYLNDLDHRDEPAVASQLGIPILILRGERDYQVIDQDIAIWRAGLAHTPHVTIRELPGLNHLFITGTGKPNPQEYGIPGHVDAEVVASIANFIAHPESSQ